MKAQTNIINDLSTYTRVPAKILNELIDKGNLCIGSAIHDGLQEKEEAIVINIGFGTLSVNLLTMECKFIPSKDLKAVIKASINNKVDPVEINIEDALVNKLLSIYEEEM